MKIQNQKVKLLIIGLAIIIMTIMQYTKILMGNNPTIQNLKYVSAELVEDAMLAGKFESEGLPYGLVGIIRYNGSSNDLLTNEAYTYGYHNEKNSIAIDWNEFTANQYVAGNLLEFESGRTAEIVDTEIDGDYLYVDYRFLDMEEDSYQGSQGNLQYLCVRDANSGKILPLGSVGVYESQLGLQGRIFAFLTGDMPVRRAIMLFQWGLALLFSMVIVGIAYFIYKKYNLTFSIVFYLVTMLSPWVIGFSTNLYWMEVTWFAPMLVGIYAAYHIQSKKSRILSYVFAFLTIAFKCACGYEYIPVVMLGTIVFLLSDLSIAIVRKEKKRSLFLLRTTFFMGMAALLGFVVIIMIHGFIRGDGNMIAGLKMIYGSDVLRRTLGGDSNMFGDVYAESLESPIWYVVARYFLFQTPILFGIPGIVFLPLVAISFLMLLYDVVRKKTSGEILALYIWLGIMCVSWFILGKAHSYVHTFLNYVLWYAGYMQIACYVPINWVIGLIRTRIKEKRIE